MIDYSRPLYKYIKSHRAQEFFRSGELRIGTLHDFRRQEQLGDEIGDSEEGQKTLYMKKEKDLIVLDSANKKDMPEFMRDTFITNGNNPGRAIIISDGPVSRKFDETDCFVLSMSNTFDRDAMRQFGYDACIIINKPKEFLEEISKKIKKIATFQYVEECVYQERIMEHTTGGNIHPVLLKEKKHSYQREVRAVWKPQHKKIKPVVKNFDSAIKYCSIKHNPLITDVNDFHFRVELEFNTALETIEKREIEEHEKTQFVDIECGLNDGEVVYQWKGKPIITFGRIRNGSYEQQFIYKTYLEN